jgi:HSP20 family protein
MKLDEIKHGLSSFWDSVSDGWQHLRESASSSLTRFKPGRQTDLPTQSQVDDRFYMPHVGWSMLGNDVFEDEKQIVVRLEIPGVSRDDIEVEVQDQSLVVFGEKRFEREETQGQYRVLQCAYGQFRRVVPLPSAVLSDQAKAVCKDGVLRVELPKVVPTKPRRQTVQVS